MSRKSAQPIISQFSALSIDEQSVLLSRLVALHERGKAQRLKALQAEMQRLSSREIKLAKGVKKTRAKPQPTHRSKKNRKLIWSGRGSMPRWMREEMKALKLKPDAFLIVKK